MLILFIKNHFKDLFTIASIFGIFFFITTFFIMRQINAHKKPHSINPAVSGDLEIIDINLADCAGEEMTDTQLDLARAYIEFGKHDVAKKMLQSIIKQGNLLEQKEAQRLLGLM